MSNENAPIHSLTVPTIEAITPLTIPGSKIESVEIIKSGQSDPVFSSIKSEAKRMEENGISLQSELTLNKASWELLKDESLRQHVYDSFEAFCDERSIEISDLTQDEKTGKVTLILKDRNQVSTEVIFEPQLSYTFINPKISITTIFNQNKLPDSRMEIPYSSHYNIFLGLRDLIYVEDKYQIMQRYKHEISLQKEGINFNLIAKQISLLADRGVVSLTLEQLTALSKNLPNWKVLLEQAGTKQDISDRKELYSNMLSLIKFSKNSNTGNIGSIEFAKSSRDTSEDDASSDHLKKKLNCLSLMEDTKLLQTILTYEIEWRQLVSLAEEKDLIRNPAEFISSVFNMVRAHYPEKRLVIDAIIQAYDALLRKGSPILSPDEDQIVTPLKFLTNSAFMTSEDVATILTQEAAARLDQNKSANDLQNMLNDLQLWAVHRRKMYQDRNDDDYERYEAYAHVARSLTAAVNLTTLNKYYRAIETLDSQDW